MKKIIYLLFAIVAFTACSDDDKVGPGKLQVTVEIPSEFSGYDVSDIEVVLESVVSSETKVSLKPDGTAQLLFENIVPGTYKLSASVSGKYSDYGINKSGKFKLVGAENNLTIEGDKTTELTLSLVASDAGGLVISEFYYNLTWTASGAPYMEDHYIHIYNNSDAVIYADGLYVGSSTVTSKNPDIFADQDHIYLSKVFRIPGSGQEHPVQPGEYIVLANDGMDHTNDENGNPGRSIDLSGADFEFFTHDNGASREDVDFENVPNLEQTYFFNRSWDWSPHNSHPIITIFRTDDFDTYPKVDERPGGSNKVVKAPVDIVIDGYEANDDGDNTQKHLPNFVTTSVFSKIDAGWQGLGVRRKVADTVDGRNVLQNTRNSNEDFETFEIYPGSSTPSSNVQSKAFNIHSMDQESLKMLREISNGF